MCSPTDVAGPIINCCIHTSINCYFVHDHIFSHATSLTVRAQVNLHNNFSCVVLLKWPFFITLFFFILFLVCDTTECNFTTL